MYIYIYIYLHENPHAHTYISCVAWLLVVGSLSQLIQIEFGLGLISFCIIQGRGGSFFIVRLLSSGIEPGKATTRLPTASE